MFSNFFQRNKTFKPLKSHKQGSKAAQLHDYAKSTLGTGDALQAVKLPFGEDENEWLATNTVDFYNTACLVFGTVADSCTPDSCPVMSAGSRFEYLWADSTMKPTRMCAVEYIDKLLMWVDAQFHDPTLFPVAPGQPFKPDFKTKVVAPIMRRLSRVFSHLYYSHFDAVLAMGAEKHLNSAYKHFSHFILHFNLVDPKELAPMSELIDTLTGNMYQVTAKTGGSGVPGLKEDLAADQGQGAGAGTG